jgi:hypothetical protein
MDNIMIEKTLTDKVLNVVLWIEYVAWAAWIVFTFIHCL